MKPLLGVSLALSLSALGCDTTCDTRDDTSAAVVYAGGRVDASRTFYETAAFDEPFLSFPPGRRYELWHGLVAKPSRMGIYVAFDDAPFASDNNAAIAAGNQAVIERVDSEVVTVRNDTCAELYLRVELSVVVGLEEIGSDAGMPDSGTASDMTDQR